MMLNLHKLLFLKMKVGTSKHIKIINRIQDDFELPYATLDIIFN